MTGLPAQAFVCKCSALVYPAFRSVGNLPAESGPTPQIPSYVVSRRAVLEASAGEDREALLTSLKEGTVVKGIVKNITDYGAFVDLGGIDGLLHITECPGGV